MNTETDNYYPTWEKEFQDKATAAAANIERIERNSASLNDSLLKRPTKNPFTEAPATRQGPDPKEQELQKETGTLAQDTKTLMHEMRRYLMENHENRAARIQFDRLADNFASALHEFQQYQRDVVSRERNNMDPNSGSPKLELTMASGDAADNLDAASHYPDVGRQTQQLISLDHESAEVDFLEERRRAVQSLEREIRDVNDIFKDLALLVHEQGEVMDSIEASIETGDLNLSSGLDELERARRKANKRKTRKLICYGLGVGILVTFVLSVVFGSM